ncbi:MAG: hypothetical protein KIT22_06600 [Verrucomicrobiae bacterium]|nr:hypothetical protein [Verrucomicrobiae bacterium]
MKKKARKFALLCLALLSAIGAKAQTNVIYSDPFTVEAESIFYGSTPQDHGGVGAEAWIAPDDGLTLDGASVTASSGARWAALPFFPEDGNKYRLSMDMNCTHTGADWFALGWSETPTPTGDYPAQQLSGWLLIRGLNPGYPLHSFTGYGTDGGGQAGDFTGPHNIAIVLDTTVDNWTFEFFVDGVSQRGPVAFSTTSGINPTINYVTFGSYGSARGTMDNFKLENIFHVENGAPTVVTQPIDATVLGGGVARFEVVAAGPKPISYQWYKNDQILAGETGSTLTLTGLTGADSGSTYTVKITNDFGTTTSAAARLTVLDVSGPLVHKFNFNDGTANDSIGGVTGELKGTAKIVNGQLYMDGSDGGYALLSGYPMPPSGSATVVAWFRAASSMGKSARVFDFGSGTLNYVYFSPNQNGSGGAARFGLLTGTDPEASVSYTSTLNDDREHLVAAVIDSTPTDTGANGTLWLYVDGALVGSADLNGTTTLSALDFGPQNYLGKSQWVNTGDLPFQGFIDEVRIYNTALSESEIAALAPDANPAAAPVIDTQPSDTSADLGGSFSLVVGVTGSEPLTYQWRREGIVISGVNTNVLTLTDVNTSDFAGYDVIVSNNLGSVTSRVAQVILNRFGFAPWDDDESSGIDSSYVYTHAFSFGAESSFSINGVNFTGWAGGNPSIPAAFTVTGVGNVYANDAPYFPEDSGSRVLGNDFIYGGNPGALTLRGLAPGKQYLLTLFSTGWEGPGNRFITFSSADGQRMTIDQDAFDAHYGIRISYEYTADEQGSVTIATTPLAAGNTHHMYGFANRLLNKPGASDQPEIVFQPASTSADVGGSAGFSVTATGTAPLAYQWYLGDTKINGATGNTYTNANVQSGDFGSYTVVVGNNFGSVTSIVATLSLRRFSFTSWADDESSGIDSAYVYTHAYNFGTASGTTINGVPFTGVAGGNPAVASKFGVTGVPNVFNNDANNIPDGSGSRALANDFIYGGNPGTLTLSGLTPGKAYLLTLYSVGWDAPGIRPIHYTAAGGQDLDVDQDAFDENNGIRISYQYTADAQGSVTISVAPIRATFTHHLYGFSNRELELPGTEVTLGISQTSPDSLVISWPQSAADYVLKSSNTLGTTANWQTVNATPTVVNGNYQVTVPTSKVTEFFILQK